MKLEMVMMLNREVKRVPLDFDWPIDKVWCGYHIVPYDFENKKVYDYKDKWVSEVCDEIKWVNPPTGEGYQAWETTSEGSPISPVFKTFDELCEWMDGRGKGICKTFTKEDWIKALNSKCSGVDMQTQKLVLPDTEDSP